MVDLQQEFAEGQRAYQAGDHTAASERFRRLVRQHPEQPAFHQMLGLSLKKQGKFEIASDVFETAIRRHPNIAVLHAERASLLDDLGQPEAAIAAYDRAIALDPGLHDACIDRALVLHRHMSAKEGYWELSRLAEEHPANPRVLYNLAVAARKVGELRSAEAAATKALELQPDASRIHRLRAQIALDRGHSALPLFRAAKRLAPDEPDIVKGEASAMLAEGRPHAARALLAERLERHPDWYDGHAMHARIAWEEGETEDVVATYEKALTDRPTDRILWSNFIGVIAQTLGHPEALDWLAKAPDEVAEDALLLNAKANSLCEIGELDQAEPFFDRLSDREGSIFRLPHIRFLIRKHEFEQAADRGLAMVNRGEGADAWPYVSIAWRKLNDPRWGWLEGDRALAQYYDLEEFRGEIPALATHLRKLHTTSVAPFEQSLRGGTQTDGALFFRDDPPIRKLVRSIEKAVAHYIETLPSFDSQHPVLSLGRDTFHFVGSWSVRLTDRGYHVAHIHNQGWISSAFYVTLPSRDEANAAEAGWLVLGEPPREFGLELSPIRIIEPKPGRLALFPSIMWHGTRPFPAGERMTVAFDVASG